MCQITYVFFVKNGLTFQSSFFETMTNSCRKPLVKVLLTVRIKDLDKLNLIKLAYGGLVLGLNYILLLPQLPHKIMLASKVVKRDSKIIISLR